MKDMTHQFLDWLRSKPADEIYDWKNSQTCALGQFAKSIGCSPSARTFADVSGNIIEIPEVMEAAALNFWQCQKLEPPSAYTFGAAADRLERLLAS